MVEQVVKDGIVMQGVAVAVEAGVDVVFLAGGEPVAYEFVLQERFAACGGNAAACGAQVVSVGHDLLHDFGHGHFLGLFGVQVPCVAVVAVEAAHEAALQKEDVAQPGTVHCAAGFYGMDDAFAVVMAVSEVFGGGVCFGVDGDGCLHGV